VQTPTRKTSQLLAQARGLFGKTHVQGFRLFDSAAPDDHALLHSLEDGGSAFSAFSSPITPYYLAVMGGSMCPAAIARYNKG
jgi:hypothetical protein